MFYDGLQPPEELTPAPAAASAPLRGIAARLPSYETCRWIQTGVTALLLVIALPWVVWKLLTDPAGLARSIGHSAV